MSLSGINNGEAGSDVRTAINAAIGQVNTNTTNIATNTSNIATNTSDISALNSSKQNKNAVSTLYDNYDASQTGDYTLLGTDYNKIFDITNVGASLFTLPPTGTIPAFNTGAKVIIINNESSGANITLTAGAGVVITVGGLSTAITPGTTATVIKTGVNRYKRIY